MNQPWVYMCPHPELLPPQPPSPSIPQGHPSVPALSTLSHALNLDCRSISHMVIYVFQCYSLKSSHSCLLPESKSLFFISVSFAVLDIGSLLPSFWIPYICVNILYWCFSFWLTSLCIVGSRFIHPIRTDSNVFFFNSWVIFHCVYVPQFSYPFVCQWTSRVASMS